MEGGAMSPKTAGIGVLVVIVLAMIGMYIYVAVVGTKDLSWQTSFFIVASLVIVAAVSGFVGFKAGAGRP
jgi:hypothetical protein